MSIEIKRNGSQVGKLGPNPGRLEANDVLVIYTGDEYRGYAVQFRGKSVSSGAVDTQVPTIMILTTRLERHIDKGQSDTMVDDSLSIAFIR